MGLSVIAITVRQRFRGSAKSQIAALASCSLTQIQVERLPVVLSSMTMSKAILPVGPASAGERSCCGRGALLKVSSITVLWSAEPEISTLSIAQSFWSSPSCLGCHQRKRVPMVLAS